MKKEDKYFIIALGMAAVMTAGVIVENAVSVLKPPSAQMHIDVEKVKREIDAAGLTPSQARYWKELER